MFDKLHVLQFFVPISSCSYYGICLCVCVHRASDPFILSSNVGQRRLTNKIIIFTETVIFCVSSSKIYPSQEMFTQVPFVTKSMSSSNVRWRRSTNKINMARQKIGEQVEIKDNVPCVDLLLQRQV